MDRKRIAFLALTCAFCGCAVRDTRQLRSLSTPSEQLQTDPLERIERPTRLTSSTANDYAPSITPDGRSVIYVSDRKGNADLYFRFLPGSGDVGDYPLTFHAARDDSPKISPDGRNVVFVSTREDSRGDLYILNLEKNERIPEAIRRALVRRFGSGNEKELTWLKNQSQETPILTGPTSDQEPTWGSDGTSIFFTRLEASGPNIFRLDFNESRLATPVTSNGGSMPAASLDGRFLAYVVPSKMTQGGGSIFTLNLKTGEKMEITKGPMDSSPTWSTDSQTLFFTRYASDTDGDGQITINDHPTIFSLDIAHREATPTQLTSGARYDLFPTVAGSSLIFASAEAQNGGPSNLFLKQTSSPFHSITAVDELFETAKRLRSSDPRLAALAFAEVCNRTSLADQCNEAKYERFILLETLHDTSERMGLWNLAKQPFGRWSGLAAIERIRILSQEDAKRFAETGITELKGIRAQALKSGLPDVAARTLLEEANIEGKRNREDRATSLYEEVVRNYSKNEALAGEALYKKGDLFERISGKGKGAPTWRELCRRFPNSIPWADEAVARLSEQITTSAKDGIHRKALLKEAIENNSLPGLLRARVRNELGNEFEIAKQVKEALGEYEAVIGHEKEFSREVARAQISMSRILMTQGQYEEAFRLSREAQVHLPKDDLWAKKARFRFIQNWIQKGRDELASGDARMAIRTFRNLILFDYDIPQAHRGLVQAYAATKEIGQAIELYRQEVVDHPNMYLPHYILGLAYTYLEPIQTGFGLAEPELMRAIDLNGQAVFPHQTLGFVYEKREEVLKESNYLSRGLDQYLIAQKLSEPEDDLQNYSDLTLNIGNGYFLLGDYYKAFGSYKERQAFDTPFQDPAQKLVFEERFARAAFHIGKMDVSSELSSKAETSLTELEKTKRLKPRELLTHRAENADLRALTLQQDGKRIEASDSFAEVARLNGELGDPANQAKALRNVAINLFEAQETNLDQRDDQLLRARKTFQKSLGIVNSNGSKETPKKKVGSLVNIDQTVALGDDASDAAHGFSTPAEKDLIYSFLQRIAKERRIPKEQLAALASKDALLPKVAQDDEKTKAAVTLKESILESQKGVALVHTKEYELAKNSFQLAWQKSKELKHAEGIATNATNLLRLHQIAPEKITEKELTFLLQETFQTLEMIRTQDAWKKEAALLNESYSISKDTSLKELRRATQHLQETGEIDLETKAFLLSLDVDHFVKSGHRLTRVNDSVKALNKEIETTKNSNLLLKWKSVTDSADLFDWLSSQNPKDVSTALEELFPVIQQRLDQAIQNQKSEISYQMMEWRTRLTLDLFIRTLPIERPDGLSHLSIVDASELMEVLGPNRTYVTWLPGSTRGLYLYVRANEIGFANSIDEVLRKPTRDLYTTFPFQCSTTQRCGRVASAAHLFNALSQQSIFEKRIFEANTQTTMVDVKSRENTADTWIAPANVLSPQSGPWVFDQLPLRSFLTLGAHTWVLTAPTGAPETSVIELAELASFFGVTTIRIGTNPSAMVYGALALTNDEAKTWAETKLDETIARGAELYKKERWAAAVRSFDEALDITRTQKREELREQLLDVASMAAYKGEDIPKAIVYGKELVELRRNSQSLHLADSLQFLGIVLSRNDQFDEAIQNLKEATELFQQQKRSSSQVAENLSTLGIVFENSNRYSEALQYFDSSLQTLGSSKQGSSIGDQWRRIGRIYYLRLNDNTRARQAFAKATVAFKKANDRGAEDEAILELGLLDEREGKFSEARAQYEDVLKRNQSNPSIASKANLYLANTYWFEGNYFDALKAQSSALTFAEKTKDDRLRMLARSTAGLIFWTLNDYDRALLEEERALDYAKTLKSPVDEASAYNNLGLIDRERGNFVRAINFFEKARLIDEKLKTSWGLAYDDRNIGMTYTRMGRFKEAEQFLNQAVVRSHHIGDVVNEAKSLLGLADVYLKTENLGAADSTYDKALEIAKKGNVKEVIWRGLWGKGKIAYAQNRQGNAEANFDAAIALIEDMSASIKVEEFRNGFVANKSAVYEDMIFLLINSPRPNIEKAWSYAERSRARSFIDLLGNKNIARNNSGDQHLLSRERSLRLQSEELETQLSHTQNETERATLSSHLAVLRRARTDLIVEIRATNPELSSFVSVDPIQLNELRTILKTDSALVEFFITTNELLAWVITDETFELFRTKISKQNLEKKIAQYSKLMQGGSPLLKESTELYQWIWKPIEKSLRGKRFVGISPHSTLHYLPFASLFDGKTYIVDRNNLFFTPSASVLKFTTKQSQTPKSRVRVLAIGNPDLGDPSLALPFAEKEASSIRLSFSNVDLLTGKNATDDWLKQHGANYNVIHLATHGEFDPVNPLLSAILFASKKQGRENLEADEIFKLTLNADLVTLSACQSGLAKIEGGDELIGLNRAFMFAGTHSILSSLWRVHDVSTAVLIKHFYRHYANESKAESLREAMLRVKDYYPHPSYWSAFFLSGDYR